MKRRTRLLAIGALVIVGGWLAVLVVRSFVTAPLRAVDDQIAGLREKLAASARERADFMQAESFLRGMAGRTFGNSPDTASAEVADLLTGHILRVGLQESDFTRIPVGRHKLPGAVEVGWTVQGEGPLDKIVDLLFLLDEDPRLHRIEGLSISAGSKPDRRRVRFRFLTLVLSPAPPAGTGEPLPEPSLETPGRTQYALITRRDLLRPYVRRREKSGAVVAFNSRPAEPLTNEPYVDPANFRVVSLSSWGSGPEVHVRDLREDRMRVLRPGDKLPDATILGVDYRPRPRPDKPGLLSYSRVILRQDETLYAVECGQTLADRRPLTNEDLPPDLRP